MLDLAREQMPTRDHLFTYAKLAHTSGYQSLGLYLEHRFAFECTPWSHGQRAITAETIQDLQSEFPSLKIVPFINILGHMEGFIYTQQGRHLREELFTGLQACPSNPELQILAKKMVDEVIQAFSSDLIHIGGDETYQLHKCPRCQSSVPENTSDQKAWLYHQFYKPILNQVIQAKRTPGIWGDMFLDHPDALTDIPQETVIFDWQYMKGVAETAPKFKDHKVFGCPTLHVYNAPWMHLEGTEKNIREVSRDVQDQGLHGVCITLWEGGLFGAYDSFFPAIKWAREAITEPSTSKTILDFYKEESTDAESWAKLMGIELEEIGGVFQFRQLRNPLKARLLLYSNPFLCWMHHHGQLSGSDGDTALVICDKALQCAPNESAKNATIFVRSAIEFVRISQTADEHYSRGETEKAIAALTPARYIFDTLHNIARHNHERIGGSLADMERCTAAKKHVETVMHRIRTYGDGALGYIPAFEVITNPRFMPHDQGCWWIVNKWANE